MSDQPADDEPRPDALLQAYRRAGESDRSQPSPAVRAAILAHAASATRLQTSRWKWKAAASIAVVGLVGVLASQIFGDRARPPQEPAAAVVKSPSEAAPSGNVTPSSVAPAPSSVLPPSDLTAAASPRTARKAPKQDHFSMRPSAPQDALAPVPSPSEGLNEVIVTASSPSISAAPAARVAAGASAQRAQEAAQPDPWRDRTLVALRLTYPELFNAPASAGQKQVAMVLNQNGTVYRSAIDASSTTPAHQLFQSLGVDASELESPARVLVFARSWDHPDDLYVTLAVRKNRN